MDVAEYHEHAAKGIAGEFADALIEKHGLDVGGAMLRGYVRAFVLAHIALSGWEATEQLFSSLLRHRPQNTRGVPDLRVVQNK